MSAARYLFVGLALSFVTSACSINSADDFQKYRSNFEKIIDVVTKKYPVNTLSENGTTVKRCNDNYTPLNAENCDEDLTKLMEDVGVSQILVHRIYCQLHNGPGLQVDFMGLEPTNLSSPRVITYSECDDEFKHDSEDTEVRQLATHWYLKIGRDPF